MMALLKRFPGKYNDQGFTFIEIMVSIVVIGIGLLGLSKLQLTSLRYNQNAYQRSIATQLVYDISNRMRANKQGVESGAYYLSAAQKNTRCFTNDGCSPAELAEHDIYEWLSPSNPGSVANQLPNGSAMICIDSTPDDGNSSSPQCDGFGSQHAIKIWWSEDAGKTTHRFVTSVQI